MAYPVQRITSPPEQSGGPNAHGRALLLERVAAGLAHEGKNPLHNMALHIQLVTEKLASGTSAVERHLQAMRDGIGRVDALLRAFGEFANPGHLPADVGAALARTVQLFQYDARRASVHVTSASPASLIVEADTLAMNDVIAHVFVAAIELARDGGNVDVRADAQGQRAIVDVVAAGGAGSHKGAEPHLAAARRLAAEAPCELSIETPPAGGARLSLSFPHPR